MILEACVGNLKDALSSQEKGAHQIELCDRLDLDGTSPPQQLVASVCTELDIPVKVIVNPNTMDYQYSDRQMDEILRYVDQISQYDIKGIVFGPIDDKGMPDLSAIARITSHTTLPITYHKAIDASPDIIKATQALVDQGLISSILSSGGCKTAWEGRETLLKMKQILAEASGDIQLIGAGRITNDNLNKLDEVLGLESYHGKLIMGKLGR